MTFENLISASPQSGYDGFCLPLLELVERSIRLFWFRVGEDAITPESFGLAYCQNGNTDVSDAGYSAYLSGGSTPDFGCDIKSLSGIVYSLHFVSLFETPECSERRY